MEKLLALWDNMQIGRGKGAGTALLLSHSEYNWGEAVSSATTMGEAKNC